MTSYRVYLDSSVIGGCLDAEFAVESQRVIDLARKGQITALLSAIVLGEIETAPEGVREILRSIPPENVEIVTISAEVRELRGAYLAADIVGPKSVDDATHVAAATLARADAIVSWNFRHIVRLDKIKAYNKVNRDYNYDKLTIITPLEVRLDETD